MYGSRGDVEPLAGLAVRLRGLGAKVRVCPPPEALHTNRASNGLPPVNDVRVVFESPPMPA